MSSTVVDSPERLYSLRELSDMGYGSRRANQTLIRNGRVPAVLVGGAYKVAASDLHYLAQPAGPPRRAAASDTSVENLETIAASLVSTWPRLSPERKAELGRLLAA